MAIVFVSNPDSHTFVPAIIEVDDAPRAIAERCDQVRMVPIRRREDGATMYVHRDWIAMVEPDPALEQPDQQEDHDDQKEKAAADVHAVGVPLNRNGES